MKKIEASRWEIWRDHAGYHYRLLSSDGKVVLESGAHTYYRDVIAAMDAVEKLLDYPLEGKPLGLGDSFAN